MDSEDRQNFNFLSKNKLTEVVAGNMLIKIWNSSTEEVRGAYKRSQLNNTPCVVFL